MCLIAIARVFVGHAFELETKLPFALLRSLNLGPLGSKTRFLLGVLTPGRLSCPLFFGLLCFSGFDLLFKCTQ